MMTAVFLIKDAIPDELVIGFFTVFGGEGLLCAVITVIKKLVGNRSNDIELDDVEEEYIEEEE